MKEYFRFAGGIHPEYDGKELTAGKRIQTAPLLDRYVIVLAQNAGAPPELLVAPGDMVKRGQLIAKASSFVSANLHAPTSGKIDSKIQIPGPNGVLTDALVLIPDGEDAWTELPGAIDWRQAEPAELKQRIIDCGIVGMGGAAFPTAVKLSPPAGKSIDHVILNGAECEPYLTADHMLMWERPLEVLAGAAMLGRAAGVTQVTIAVENNKLDAIARLREHAAEFGVDILELPVTYPQGSEKQLIFAVTGRKVPAGGLPMDAGCVVQNVATALAVRNAIDRGEPLIERVVTVTGDVVTEPGNWWLRLGTPLLRAVELAGGVTAEPAKLILGGPMMGFAQRTFEGSVMKNTSGILLLSRDAVRLYDSSACVRCGRCLRACPMHLAPGPLSMQIESERYELAGANHVMDCLECGACAYVCPANRPLVQHMRRAKSEIRKLMKKGK